MLPLTSAAAGGPPVAALPPEVPPGAVLLLPHAPRIPRLDTPTPIAAARRSTSARVIRRVVKSSELTSLPPEPFRTPSERVRRGMSGSYVAEIGTYCTDGRESPCRFCERPATG